MARRVFFSFHYERDIWRANVVRNHWMTKPDREQAGFWDASLWEEAKKKGQNAIQRMIDSGMAESSVTAVLIGKETSDRQWVKYEIQKSYADGKGLLGVYIHNIRDDNQQRDTKGDNIFGEIGKDANGRSVYFSQVARSYDWVNDDGFSNFADWVEAAAKGVGR